MSPRGWPGAWFIAGSVFVILTDLPSYVLAAGVTLPSLSQVLALPSADRASLVIELTEPVERATLTSGADNKSATIEIGPLKAVTSQDLVSVPNVHVIASVAVRGYQQSPATFARVVVRMTTTCHQRVRVAGRRVYLDLVPVESLGTTPIARPPAPSVASAKAPVASVMTEGAIEEAYRALEADGIRRARALAVEANVKALDLLRGEVIRKDVQFGRKRPDMVSHLLDEIDRYAVEARGLRLKRDGALFHKPDRIPERKPG